MVNPAKLKSLVDQHATGLSPTQLGLASPAGPPPDDGMDMDDEDEDGEAPQDPAARGQELIEQWGEFGEEIEDGAEELNDLAHDVGAELLLKDVPEDAVSDVEKAVDRMPDDLSMGLAKYVSKLPPEDVTALATALVADLDEDAADVNLLASFLTQAAKYAEGEFDEEDLAEFNEPDEDEEEDDEEEPEADEAAAPDDGESGGGGPTPPSMT